MFFISHSFLRILLGTKWWRLWQQIPLGRYLLAQVGFLMNEVMATLHSQFASSEYVKRWLANVDSIPGADVQAEVRRSFHSKRHRAPSIDQDRELQIHTSPKNRRKRIASGRCRSPERRKAHSAEGKSENESHKEQELSRCASSDLPAAAHAKNLTSKVPQSPKIAPDGRSKKYARRSRHKPTADRYEYKGGGVTSFPVKKVMETKHKRSKRNKTGNTLNQEFRAPNVEQERLTLKASAGPGIFRRGKASAQLQTRGLPDLTFSEMKFLSKKRQPDLAQLENQKQSNPTEKKDRSKEISAFFAKARSEVTRSCRASSELHQRQDSKRLTQGSNSLTISSPAKLARRTKFSLASEGVGNPRRYARPPKQVLPTTDYDAMERVTQSKQRQISERPAVDFAGKPVVFAPTSGPRSVTPSRRESRREAVKRPADAELVAPQSVQQPKMGSMCESSVTNSSLDRYTKHLLLRRHDNLSLQSHRAPWSPRVFSLDDLKGLARIAEIEESYSGLGAILSPQERTVEQTYTSIAPGASAPYCDRMGFGYGKYPAISQPQGSNLLARPSDTNVPATHEILPDPKLQLGDYEQYTAHVDQVQHHNRPGHIPDAPSTYFREHPRNKQQLYDTKEHQPLVSVHLDMVPELDFGAFHQRHDENHKEKSYLYHETAQQTIDPAMSILPDVGYMGFDEYTSDGIGLESDLPELYGLQHKEYMEGQMESHVQGSEAQLPDHDYGQPDMNFSVIVQDPAEQNISSDCRKRGSTGNERSALHVFESPEEEFRGFSRPQILYSRKKYN